jgi:hypothetical protein
VAVQPLWALAAFFCFLIYTQSVGLLGRVSVRRKATTYTQNNTTQNKGTQTSVPRMEFVSTTAVFGQAKIVHVLNRAATAISNRVIVATIYVNTFPYVLLNVQIM